MPSKGNDARSAAMAELAVLMHETLTAPQLASALAAAEARDADPVEAASVREMSRQWRAANLLPASLVEAKSLAGTRCEHAWRTQRKANDWTGFLENWRPVVACARKEATLLAEATGLSRYDALVDRFEPGMTSAVIEPMFADAQAVAAAADRGGAREAAHRAGDRSRSGRSRSRRSAHSASRSWASSASTSTAVASTCRRIRSAAAWPRTSASRRATARTTSCRR